LFVIAFSPNTLHIIIIINEYHCSLLPKIDAILVLMATAILANCKYYGQFSQEKKQGEKSPEDLRRS
jgi:hypothetical protein